VNAILSLPIRVSGLVAAAFGLLLSSQLSLAIDAAPEDADWPVQRVFASDGADGDYFGFQVAVIGSSALVTAPDATIGGNTNQGAAYAFTRDSLGNWQQAQKLSAGVTGDKFGYSLSMQSSTAFIGAPYAAGRTSTAAGVVRIYSLSGTTWNLAQTLNSPAGLNSGYFGISLASTDSKALVLGRSNLTGWQLYAYARDTNGVWQLTQTIPTPADYDWSQYFPMAIAMNANTALLPFPTATVGDVTEAGTVFVYTYANGLWGLTDKLIATDGTNSAAFGGQVALTDYGAVLVSAPFQRYHGAVYEFRKNAGLWTQTQEITVPVANALEAFGFSLAAMRGTFGSQTMPSFVAGNPLDFVPSINEGAAHVFTYDGTSWVELAKLKWPDLSTVVVGTGVAIDLHTVMVAGVPQLFQQPGAGVVDFYTRP